MNPYLTGEQRHHLLADVTNAREALAKLETAVNGDAHPKQMADHVREIETWISFARIFCAQAIRFDAERRERLARTPAND